MVLFIIIMISYIDIRWINYEELRRAGYEAICFDKDNTLTLPYDINLHPNLTRSILKCRKHFTHRILLVSNSAGGPDDPDGQEAIQLESSLQIPVLRHQWKKPACGQEIINHFRVAPEKIVMIGDRLMTDIVMANQLKMFSVMVRNPLGLTNDNPSAIRLRSLEHWLLNHFYPSPPESPFILKQPTI